MKKVITSLFIIAAWVGANAQWTPTTASGKTKKSSTDDVKYYKLDINQIRKELNNAQQAGKSSTPTIINVPTIDGKIERFAVYSLPVVEESFAKRYQLGSYTGVGIDDPSAYIRFSVAPNDFQSMLYRNGKYQFIEPTDRAQSVYRVFYKTKKTADGKAFECLTHDHYDIDKLESNRDFSKSVTDFSRTSDRKFRNYRLAVSVTGEYTQYFGGVPQAAAAINATITRVNGVFEKDFAVHLTVQDLPQIIFTDPKTDPYDDASIGAKGTWNLQLQRTLTKEVGNDNYDVGHLFGRSGGGGNAGDIGNACRNPKDNNDKSSKGSGYTSPNVGGPEGDAFDIDFVAHELGHQLGANHTFAIRYEGTPVQVEPGSGSTIMGYAGITSADVQDHSDAYFNGASIQQVQNYITSQTCGTITDITHNTPPVIEPLSNYSIPKGTPFVLTAKATDAEDNDRLTYTWEQADTMSQTVTTVVGDYKYGPKFRSLSPTTNPTRYFPKLSSVLEGKLVNEQEWEAVSNIARELNFNVTVRDNSPNVQEQQTATAKMKVTVTNDGPFSIINKKVFNNTITDITWDTAKTEAAPYNVANVKVDYSIDGGNTWTVLSESTPNDGGEKYDFKTLADDAVLYVRISAIDNIFYTVKKFSISKAVECDGSPVLDLNTSNITINEATVSWEGVVNADKYSLRYKKTSDTDWTTVEVNSTSHHLTNLEENVEYELGVASVCSGTVGTYAETTFQTKKLEYCPSESKNAADGHIINVTVTNHQGTKVSNDSQGKPYSDFTEEPEAYITLEKGSENNRIDVTKGWRATKYNEGVSAWIDFNRDGIFDDSEKILSSAPSKTNPAYRTFDVPNNAYTGDKPVRLRVILKYGETPKSGCETGFNYGEVEDYSVFIKENLAVNDVQAKAHQIVLYPNPATDVLNLSKASANATYEIYSTAGNLVQKGKVVDAKISITSLAQGVYIINVNDNGASQKLKFIKKP